MIDVPRFQAVVGFRFANPAYFSLLANFLS